MENEQITKIIKLCLALDQKSFLAYDKFKKIANTKQIKNFWSKVCDEEKAHIIFWKALLNLSKKGLISQVFVNPDEIIKDLEEIKKKANKELLEIGESTDISKQFLIALRLEFFLINSTFAVLFHYAKLFSSDDNPEDTYEEHISGFIEVLNVIGNITPELELMGEILNSLWKENKKLASSSTLDELTGVLNRRGFYSVIKPLSYFSSRNKDEIGIMMVDIDLFKKINDTHGHASGDVVLKQVASILQNNIRKSDILSRYGGEEFVIFLPATDPDKILKFGEKLRKNVESETKKNINATISIGISHGVLGKDVNKDIIKHIIKADECLYEAKAKGRNKVIVKSIK